MELRFFNETIVSFSYASRGMSFYLFIPSSKPIDYQEMSRLSYYAIVYERIRSWNVYLFILMWVSVIFPRISPRLILWRENYSMTLKSILKLTLRMRTPIFSQILKSSKAIQAFTVQVFRSFSEQMMSLFAPLDGYIRHCTITFFSKATFQTFI